MAGKILGVQVSTYRSMEFAGVKVTLWRSTNQGDAVSATPPFHGPVRRRPCLGGPS